MTTTKYAYAESRDAEVWREAEADTRIGAATLAFKETGGDVVYVGDKQPVDKLSILVPDADWVIEMADDKRDDIASWWDETLFDNTESARHRLQDLLRLACETWLKEYPGPDVWEIGVVTEHRPDDTFPATQ